MGFNSRCLIRNSVRGLSAGSVPGFSVLATNFPYRTFSSIKLLRNFGSPEKGLFFRATEIVGGVGPQIIFLRGITGLMGRSRKQAFSIVLGALKSLNCCAICGIVGTGRCKGVPRREGEVCVITFGCGGGIRGFGFPSVLPLARATFSLFSGGGRRRGCCVSNRHV